MNDIKLGKSSEIIRVVSNALSKIDPRLMDHGKRVAYIAAKIYHESPEDQWVDLSRLSVLCVLHDIGAYKTDEIDDMVRFETQSYFDHSLYGYLFLKNTTYLAEHAEAILYHHTDYTDPELRACPCARYAELINLADRIDILLQTERKDLSTLRALSGSKFNPSLVEAFFRAELRYNISEKIASGEYLAEAESFAARHDAQNDEVMDYLRLLVYAIDFRSPYTVTHTMDTVIICMETGKLLGLSRHELQTLYIGAFLHDIGKIAIPYKILEKPDKLTPEEFEIVKRHIPEGEKILRGVVSDEICDVALRHHEKLDGSGYSHGLSGDSLTLPQRIVTVADILSALSQRRSYKEPFPKERVISILIDMKTAGKLCPLVVDTVCLNYDMILEATQRSHDPVKQMYGDLISEYTRRHSQLLYQPAETGERKSK